MPLCDGLETNFTPVGSSTTAHKIQAYECCAAACVSSLAIHWFRFLDEDNRVVLDGCRRSVSPRNVQRGHPFTY